jgi:hypothetical protein
MQEQPSIHPEHLSELFQLPDNLQGHDWSAADLSQMLRHQLQTRLAVDLSRVDAGDLDQFLHAGGGAEPLETFADLFRHPSPPVELLLRAKNFAKMSDAPPEPTLPRPAKGVSRWVAVVAFESPLPHIRITPVKSFYCGTKEKASCPAGDSGTRSITNRSLAW